MVNDEPFDEVRSQGQVTPRLNQGLFGKMRTFRSKKMHKSNISDEKYTSTNMPSASGCHHHFSTRIGR
jgi:hypothetical protein